MSWTRMSLVCLVLAGCVPTAETNPAVSAWTGDTTASNGNQQIVAATGSTSAVRVNATATDLVPGKTSWILTPYYGEAYNNGPGQSMVISGYSTVPGASINILVLDPANQEPMSTSTWRSLAVTAASSTGETMLKDTVYPWSVNLDLGTALSDRTAWPSGGVAHIRALADGQDSATFDNSLSSCESLLSSPTWDVVSLDCTTGSPFLTLVDDSNTQDTRSGPYLLFAGPTEDTFEASTQETQNYYATIDVVGNQIDTLAHFRSTYGMSPTSTNVSSNELLAIYYNYSDLGFGREMHCTQSTDGSGKVGCYVTNYGLPPGGPVETATNLAIARSNPVATVAMEYRPNDAQNKITFMVYGADGNLLDDAALDSEGNKPTPLICLTCHGGTYNTNTHSISGTNFLPFDVQALAYSTHAGYTLSDQQDIFRQLNNLVLQTNPVSTISSEIQGWYQPLGVTTPGATANTNYIPPGWVSQPGLYNNVIKPYCRGCHNAQPAPLCWPTFADFETYKAQIQNDVCSGTALMPNSEQTYLHFWSSGARGYIVDTLGLDTACAPQ